LIVSAAWFAPLVTLPTVIDGPGQYLTRCGETVNVTEATTRHKFGCIGTYPCGIIDRWHRSGRLYFGQTSANDIVSKA
jgi:hypothetical protein